MLLAPAPSPAEFLATTVCQGRVHGETCTWDAEGHECRTRCWDGLWDLPACVAPSAGNPMMAGLAMGGTDRLRRNVESLGVVDDDGRASDATASPVDGTVLENGTVGESDDSIDQSFDEYTDDDTADMDLDAEMELDALIGKGDVHPYWPLNFSEFLAGVEEGPFTEPSTPINNVVKVLHCVMFMILTRSEITLHGAVDGLW
jgi:hypothetical protein